MWYVARQGVDVVAGEGMPKAYFMWRARWGWWVRVKGYSSTLLLTCQGSIIKLYGQNNFCSNKAFRSVQVRQTRQRALGTPHVGPIEPQRAEDGRRLGVATAVRQAPGRPYPYPYHYPYPYSRGAALRTRRRLEGLPRAARPPGAADRRSAGAGGGATLLYMYS